MFEHEEHVKLAEAMIIKYGPHAALCQAKWYLEQATGPGMYRDEWAGVVDILQEKKNKIDKFYSTKGGE